MLVGHYHKEIKIVLIWASIEEDLETTNARYGWLELRDCQYSWAATLCWGRRHVAYGHESWETIEM